MPVTAAESTLTTAEKTPTYLELKAKVAYLRALLGALREGKTTPKPTFEMLVRGDVVEIQGTLARTPNKMMEICGPMVKGYIDWGDGTTQSIHGLGCSGAVHTFSHVHQYAKPGLYHITLKQSDDWATTKVVSAGSAKTDVSRLLLVTTKQDATVSARGVVTLDTPLPDTCLAMTIAALDWGDGNRDFITTTCENTQYQREHTYGTPGTYTIIVRDQDGDAKQETVTVR